MTQEHPITPPPELVDEWAHSLYGYDEAARWGYAQRSSNIEDELQKARNEELEACCEWLKKGWLPTNISNELRAFRRPNPPSLKEQALNALDAAILRGDCFSASPAKDILRRALESIPDPS